MKKNLVILFLCAIGFTNLRAGEHPPSDLSGTYPVGSSQPVYKKLTDVAAVLNDPANTVTGDLVFELDSDYDGTTGETFPITFKQFAVSGGDWTVTIRPKAGATLRTTAGDPGASHPLILLDGADRLLLDGRPGGAGTDIRWLIRNARTATNIAPTIQLNNDAKYNTLTYLQAEGQSDNSYGAVIFLGSTTGATGNDSNTISYCTVRDLSNTTGAGPRNGISIQSALTSAYSNGTIITHNNIFNFTSTGIYLATNSNETEVLYNNIYRTRSLYSSTGDITFIGINIADDATINTHISYNYIGGTQPGCAGAPLALTTTPSYYTRVVGVLAVVTGGTGNRVDHNTIGNFDIMTGYVYASGGAVFNALYLSMGTVDITDNIIGSQDRNNDINVNIVGGTNPFTNYMIFCGGKSGSATGNKIGGITFMGSGLTAPCTLGGMNISMLSGTGAFTISDNAIGSTTVSNSIRSLASGIPVSFYGLTANLGANMQAVVKNNTIAGVELSYSGNLGVTAVGIAGGSSAGSTLIEGNTISNMSVPAIVGNTPGLSGIRAGGANTVIRKNTISGLYYTQSTPRSVTGDDATLIAGINILSSGTHEIYGNNIYGLRSANVLNIAPTRLIGIELAKAATIYNNLVMLDNGTNTNNCELQGIRANGAIAGTVKVFYNSIYLGGNNGTSSNTASSMVLSRSVSSCIFNIRNNIFVNARTGGSGGRYIYYNPGSSAATNWTATTSDYNLLITSGTAVGFWATAAQDSTQWRTKGGDINSRFYTTARLAPADLFTNVATGDLSIKESARDYVMFRGASGTGITTDYTGRTRSSLPSIGAYEYMPPGEVPTIEILSTSLGDLSPTFDKDILSYTGSVDAATSNLMLLIVPTYDGTTVAMTVNGTPVAAPILTTFAVGLAAGGNTIEIVLTAQDGVTTQTYTLTVTRANATPPPTLALLALTDGILSPAFAPDALSYTATVGHSASSLVLTAIATDAQAGVTVMVNGTPVMSGNILLNTGANTIEVTVTAEDGIATQTYTIVITREAVPNNPPAGLDLGAAAIDENVAAGSVVGGFTTADPDPDTFTYTLVSGAGDTDNAAFTIDDNQLKINASPDYETKNTYYIRVRTTDGGLLYFEKEFTITITDLNEYPPVIISHSGAASVTLSLEENLTAVTTVTATDADPGTRIVYSVSDLDDGAYFAIDSVSGALSFVTAPDFERPIDPDENNLYTVTVQASDGAFTAVQRFKVKVTNVNDNAPEFGSYDGDASVTLRMPENTAVIGTVWAVDKEPGTTLVYRIADGQDGALCSIDPVTGVFRFITAPDFDQPSDTDGDNVYMVTVEAFDGSLSTSQRFKIKITDENDNTPVFTSHNGNVTVELQLPENSLAVTAAAATDGDAGAVVTYSIVPGGDGALFTVDAATGQLAFINAPDFEHPADDNTDNIYTVTVSASDGSLSATQQFNIRITDVYDIPMMLTMTMKLPENAVEVTNLEATGGAPGSGIALSIFGEEDAALFTIDAATGNLLFLTAPDFEQPADANTDNTYMVSVKMSDGSAVVILRLKIKITDVDESTGRSSAMAAKGPGNAGEEKAPANTATEANAGKNISVYPNPVTGRQFTLRVSDLQAGKYTLELYSLTGQSVYRRLLEHTGRSISYPVQLPASLTRGMYVLKLAGAGVLH
ncbi:MAG: cadherin-like beta sandwich domain-containing protein, partial [Chitinophagaceae bacterium]